jgi:hypothetical protein
MLIPIADVPRWYAERKAEDAIAISHGGQNLTWWQLERNTNRRAPKTVALAISRFSASCHWPSQVFPMQARRTKAAFAAQFAENRAPNLRMGCGE